MLLGIAWSLGSHFSAESTEPSKQCEQAAASYILLLHFWDVESHDRGKAGGGTAKKNSLSRKKIELIAGGLLLLLISLLCNK